MKLLAIIICAFGLTLMAENLELKEGATLSNIVCAVYGCDHTACSLNNITIQECLSEVYCSEEDCQHLACDAVTNCSEEKCPRHVDTLMFSEEYDINLTEGHSILEFSKTTLDIGITFNNSIKFISEGNLWLTVYTNDYDANPVPLNQSKWLPENVVIESTYRPVVRKHKGKWIIIFEK